MPATMEITCPSCAARSRARAEWAGRSVRCKQCKAVFTIPAPGEAEEDAYALAEPPPTSVSGGPEPPPSASGSTFRPTYREGPSPPSRDRRPPRRKRARPPMEVARAFGGDLRVRLLAGLAVAGLVLAIATFLVPGFRDIGGWILLGSGFLLVGLGYFVGAYAAFREDFLYGFFYLVFPLYTGYYLVTRWEDLWPWHSAATIGFLMFSAGVRALELSLGG